MANPQGDAGLMNPASMTQLIASRQAAADAELAARLAKLNQQNSKSKLGPYSQLLADPMLPKETRQQIYSAIQKELSADIGIDPIMRQQILGQIPQTQAAPEKPQEKGYVGEAGEFLQTGLASAAGGLISLPGDLATLAGSDKVGPAISNFGKAVQNEFTPESVKLRVDELQKMIDNEAVTPAEIAAYAAKNPDLWAYFGGQFLGGGGAAKLGIKGATKVAQATKLISGGLKPLTEATAIAGSMSLGEVGGLQNQIYNEVLQDTKNPMLAAQAKSEVLKQPEVWAAALAGTIPIAELGFVARSFPTLARMPRYARIFAAGTGEAVQEYGQESAQASAEMGAKGDTRSIAERMASPEAVKQGVLGGVIGGIAGGVAGAVNPQTETEQTKIKPGSTVTFEQIYPSIAGIIGKDLSRRAKNVAKNGGTVESLRSELISFLSTAPQVIGRKNKDELIASIPEFVDKYIADFTKGTPLPGAAPAGSVQAGAQAAGAVPATTLPGTPVNASPVTPATASQPAPAIGSPNAAPVAAAVENAENVDSKATKLNERATKNLDTAAGKIAEAALSEDGNIEDVFTKETKKARAILEGLKKNTEEALSSNVKVRKAVYDTAYNSARARGANEIEARAYASEMMNSVVIPVAGNVSAAVEKNIATLDSSIAQKYRIRPISDNLGGPTSMLPTLARPKAPESTAQQAGASPQPASEDIIDVPYSIIPEAPLQLGFDRNRIGYDESYDRLARAVGGPTFSKMKGKKRYLLEDKSREGVSYPDFEYVADAYAAIKESAPLEYQSLIDEMTTKESPDLENFVAAAMEYGSGRSIEEETTTENPLIAPAKRNTPLTKEFFKALLKASGLPPVTKATKRPKA